MTTTTDSTAPYTGKAADALARVKDVSEKKNAAKKEAKTFSDEQSKLFIEAVKEGVSVTDLADASNISRRAIYRQLSTYEEVTGERLVNRYGGAVDGEESDDE